MESGAGWCGQIEQTRDVKLFLFIQEHFSKVIFWIACPFCQRHHSLTISNVGKLPIFIFFVICLNLPDDSITLVTPLSKDIICYLNERLVCSIKILQAISNKMRNRNVSYINNIDITHIKNVTCEVYYINLRHFEKNQVFFF